MITDIEICGTQETQKHIRYLEQTPVRGLADILRSENYILKKGYIKSHKYLGSLKTEFEELGGISSRVILNQDKFIVSQVITILRRTDCYDKKTLESIEYFMERDNANELELTITIFHNEIDYIIKDGNKRAVAFYERRKRNNEENIVFPVYIIEPIQSK